MKRESIGEMIFWCAVGAGLALYALSAPHGVPWHPGQDGRCWRYMVAMACGSAVALASVLAAVSAGLLGAVANRYLGWRVGVAAALAWLFAPWVWNRAILGDSGLAVAALVAAALWVGSAVFLFATRKARSVRRAHKRALELDDDTAAAVHNEEMRRARKNRKVSWAVLGAAMLFAVLSASMHDYTLGEAASVYARLVAEEGHPDRFSLVTGRSTTPEKWLARWEAMKPYLASSDPFIPVLRRALAYEGNALGNALVEKGETNRAWSVYWRVFDEIDPRNPAACVNLNAMLQSGHVVDAPTRARVAGVQADFAKQLRDRRRAVGFARQIAAFGPVMRDEKAYEELRAKAAARMSRLRRQGVKMNPPPDLRPLKERRGERTPDFLIY